jgi:hypothetical protein
MNKLIAALVSAVVVAGCSTAPAPPTPAERDFLKVYDIVRPVGDTSGREAILSLGRSMCHQLAKGVDFDLVVHTLAFDKDNKPTGMTVDQGKTLATGAVVHLCPDQRSKLK